MKKQSIAIVGLGTMGTAFLDELLGQSNESVEIVAVAEINNTAGLALAKMHGIGNFSIDELVAMGSKLDILFDLTGEESVRQDIRGKLSKSGNHHTIVATDNIARMIWALIATGTELPSSHTRSGY
jgi:predicted dinucleotide-utilizing enzyme